MGNTGFEPVTSCLSIRRQALFNLFQLEAILPFYSFNKLIKVMVLIICFQLFSIYVEHDETLKILKIPFFILIISWKTFLILIPLLIDIRWFRTLFDRWSVVQFTKGFDWLTSWFLTFHEFLGLFTDSTTYHSISFTD